MEKNVNPIYRYLTAQGGIKTLEEGRLRLSGTNFHNDPFEALPATKYLTNEESKALLLEAAKKGTIKSLLKEWGIDEKVIAILVKAILAGSIVFESATLAVASAGLFLWNKMENGKGDEETEMEYQQCQLYLKECLPIIENTRLCCFSAVPDNIVMWGHYAKDFRMSDNCPININHAGIVISFSKNKQYWPNSIWRKIKYRDKRMELPTPGMDFREYAYKLMTWKFEKWKYEQEWRLIRPNTKCPYLRFQKDSLKGILLGLDISEENRKRIINIRDKKYQDVPILQAKKDDYEYKLFFV